MSSRDVPGRLRDIVENVNAILVYLGSATVEAYAADRRTRDAVERCLERIIEATVKIGVEEMAAIDPAFPVDRARGLGNLLRHAYDRVDEELIYNLAMADLPRLREAALRALEHR